eukprot:scaffold6.g2566.t1
MEAQAGVTRQQNGGDEEGPAFVELDPTGRWGRFDKVLGRGAFKAVYKAFDNQEGTEVAWNQVRVSELMPTKDGESKDERDRLLSEIKMLKALKHKNIMSFYAYWWDPKTYTVNFITELFTSGTLRQYRKRHIKLDPEVRKRWAWQILCGLVYLHGHTPPIIHRDLKCDNIFINGSDGTVKIGDLGLATLLRSQTAPQSVLGTPEFMAPELYEESYDAKVDVYSFGMCLLELDTMNYPYSECKNAAQIYRKVSLGIRPKSLQEVSSQELAELINLCISRPEERPESRQLLKHPYFNSVRKEIASSRSEVALLAAAGGSFDASDYGGSIQSGGVSRTTSSMADLHAGGAPPLAASTSRDSVHTAPAAAAVSRSVSGPEHAAAASERAPSDAASVRSQPSNASDVVPPVPLPEGGAGEDRAEAAGAASAPPGSAAGSLPGSAPISKTASPRDLSGHSSPRVSSPANSDGTRCDATQRHFRVVEGRYHQESSKFNLRLRICEPGGHARTVEFEFDVNQDTPEQVAGEMVADLDLSPEDAVAIALAIGSQLDSLGSQVAARMPSQQSMQITEQLSSWVGTFQHSLPATAAQNMASQSSEPSLAPAPAALAALLAARANGSGLSIASAASSSHSHGGVPPAPAEPAALPPPRTASPVPAAAPAPPDFPSPSQRILRSNSIPADAAALLRGDPFSRTSSHTRDMELHSPHFGSGATGSGAHTPPGVLSPAGMHDKRIPLGKLFENLQDLAASLEGGEVHAVERARGGATPPPHPPLPPSAHDVARQLAGSISAHALGEDARTRAGRVGPPAIARPVSMPAALVSHGEPPAAAPAPTPAAAAAAAAPVPIAGPAPGGAGASSPRSTSSCPATSQTLADSVVRVDLQQQQHSTGSLPPVGVGLRVRSRDASPGDRDSSLSPVRGAAPTCADAAALNGKKAAPPAKDKEALRKQAADAMKVGVGRGAGEGPWRPGRSSRARMRRTLLRDRTLTTAPRCAPPPLPCQAVELRSLNLLEGGLMVGKQLRGTPMAASRTNVVVQANGVPAAAALGSSSSSSNLAGLAAAPVAAPPPASTGTAAAPMMPAGMAAPAPALPAAGALLPAAAAGAAPAAGP